MHANKVVALAWAVAPALAMQYQYRNPLFRRQSDGVCEIELAQSNGGRFIGIAIDSSGSMSGTDPDNVRIPAAKELNGQLVTAAAATDSILADMVAVVDFDSSAAVIYPLGDPAGADPSFDTIDSSGGTDIADGIAAAAGEILSAGDQVSGKAGIVVLTDGGSSVNPIIEEIEAAAAAGIRVSFGFLGDSSSSQDPDIVQAILATGGTYMSFNEAANIRPWLFLLLSNGLTAADQTVEAGQPLLSGITVAKLTAGGDAVPFTYAAQASEKLVFTIESLSNQDLSAELQDGSGGTIATNATTSSDPAVIEYTAAAAGDLKLLVSAVGSTEEGVFQVNLNSSLGISGCSLNNTAPPTNVTTPSPTTSLPPVVTAGASRLLHSGLAAAGFALALML